MPTQGILTRTFVPAPANVEVSRANVARGAHVEVIPHRRLAFIWGWESGDHSLAALAPVSSLVEIDLEPTHGGTPVRLRHSGLPNSLEEIHGERWSQHLTQLAAAVLKSPAMGNPSAANQTRRTRED